MPDTGTDFKLEDALKTLWEGENVKQSPESPVSKAFDKARDPLWFNNFIMPILMFVSGMVAVGNICSLVDWDPTSPEQFIVVNGKPIDGYLNLLGAFVVTLFTLVFYKKKVDVADTAYQEIVDTLSKEYPEIFGDFDVEKLKRMMAMAPFIQSCLSPQERRDYDALVAQGNNDPKAMMKAFNILVKHFANPENKGDLQKIVDAVENKAMPWEIAQQQYAQAQQGHGARS